MRADVTALILAGGKATRLGGIDKSQLVIEGRTIFERQVEALRSCVAEILVSSPRAIVGFRTIPDAIEDGGPLAGMAAGLAACHTPWLLVVAGDMPFVTTALFERMIVATREGPDAVGIRIAGLPEPLLCVLRVAVYRAAVDAQLAARELKASRLLELGERRVVWLDEAPSRAVVNVNTPEDL